MSFLLFILSLILVVSFTPLGLLFTSIKALYKRNTHVLKAYYFNLAISLDQFGNVVMSGLFNVLLISSDRHLFGDPDETISSVLGKNQINNSLSFIGRLLNRMLNKIDSNHSVNAIEEKP